MNALANEKLKRPSVLNILLQAYKLIVNKINQQLDGHFEWNQKMENLIRFDVDFDFIQNLHQAFGYYHLRCYSAG